jgi:hypothetical protein
MNYNFQSLTHTAVVIYIDLKGLNEFCDGTQLLIFIVNQNSEPVCFLSLGQISYKLDLSVFAVVLGKHLLDFMLISFML